MPIQEKTIQERASVVESVLFVHGDPCTRKQLCNFLSCKEDILEEVLQVVRASYQREESGLSLIEKDDTLTLVTRSENAPFIQKMIYKDIYAPLSPALQEVLALVAYRSPITRQTIDHIRGVNSSFALRNLLIRGLIERVNEEEDDRAYRYRPTSLFLESVGLTSLDQLPQYEEVSKNVRLTDENTNENS